MPVSFSLRKGTMTLPPTKGTVVGLQTVRKDAIERHRQDYVAERGLEAELSQDILASLFFMRPDKPSSDIAICRSSRFLSFDEDRAADRQDDR